MDREFELYVKRKELDEAVVERDRLNSLIVSLWFEIEILKTENMKVE